MDAVKARIRCGKTLDRGLDVSLNLVGSRDKFGSSWRCLVSCSARHTVELPGDAKL